ncbi:MAG TPA: hypothetical protein DCL00_00055, partial [Opitutae bacterium]|nr:hypothetical protein [Opitutae bacterium]
MRIYGVSLNQNDIDAMWNSGSGDLGIVPVIELNTENAASQINGTVKFYQVGNQVEVDGFDSSDIIADGASFTLTSDGNLGFIISVTPTQPGVPFTISIADNAATIKGGSTLTGGTSTRFQQSPSVTSQDSLVLWCNFEGNGTNRVTDLSDRHVDSMLHGGERVPGKFSQSLQLYPGEYLNISGDNFSFNQAFTISLWLKILDDEEGVILRNGQVSLEYRDDLNLYGAVYSANGWKEIGSRTHSGKWAHYSLVNDSQFI